MRPTPKMFKMLLALKMYLILEVLLSVAVEVMANFDDLATVAATLLCLILLHLTSSSAL